MTESRAWRLWLGRKDDAARDFLLGQYERLAFSEVRHLMLVVGTCTHEDAVSEAKISLFSALTQFDPARGVKFITFATHVLRFDLQNYTRNRKDTRAYRNSKEKIYGATCRLAERGNECPTDEQVAKEATLSVKTVQLSRLSSLAVRSLEAQVGKDKQGIPTSPYDTPMELMTGIRSLSLRDPYEVMAARGGAVDIDAGGLGIYDLIDTLPEHLRAAVTGKLIEDMSFDQIAAQEGCSYQSARLWYLRGLSVVRKNAMLTVSGGRLTPKSIHSKVPTSLMSRRPRSQAKETA